MYIYKTKDMKNGHWNEKIAEISQNGPIEALLLFSVFYLPSLFLMGDPPPSDSFNYSVFHFQYLVTALPQALLVLLLYFRRFNSFSGLAPSPFRAAYVLQSLPIFLFLYLLSLSSVWISSHISGLAGLPSPQSPWRFSSYPLLPLLFFTSLLTGYCEELFFRGYLLTIFEKQGLKPWPAILVSSLLFAAGHGYGGITGIIFSALTGIFLSLHFYSRRNIHTLAIGHGLYNFLALLLTYFLPNPGQLSIL